MSQSNEDQQNKGSNFWKFLTKAFLVICALICIGFMMRVCTGQKEPDNIPTIMYVLSFIGGIYIMYFISEKFF